MPPPLTPGRKSSKYGTLQQTPRGWARHDACCSGISRSGTGPLWPEQHLPIRDLPVGLVFRWELDRFFDRTWVCIGRTEDLQTPGDQRAVAVGLESALLTRDEDGGCTPSTTCAATAGTSSSREVVAPTRSSSAALTTHRRTGSTGPSQALRGSASSRASIETVTRSCP